MKHLIRTEREGKGGEKEGIWFDADEYTLEEARAEFEQYEETDQDGESYTGYEYDGDRFDSVIYLGKFEDEEMPRSDSDFIDIIMKRIK